VEYEYCAECHKEVDSAEALYGIRLSEIDYDGDGDAAEGIKGEIDTLIEALYAAMQAYTEGIEGVDMIVYNPARYPYYFNDADASYATFTPELLRAAYNYQYLQKDPGAFAHNPLYVIQFSIDSIEEMGGDISIYTRP
jgi:hypothetical protein